MKQKQFIFALVAMLLSFVSPAFAQNVAKVGNTEYETIDEAIANWTNNATLTLLADVTLSDVVTLKSTEHHILDLSTYTMTAASGKNAIVIQACGTGDSERTAITIKADATNPGGINAGSKCVVYYKYADGGISGNDRPIIKIEGGVFTGSTSSFGTTGIYTVGTAARKCATLNISGGTFNCSINGSGKSKLIISGGVFNYSVGSQGDSTALRLISGGKFKTLGFMTADNNNTKFWFGTSMANSNVGLYVDDEGYLCVGGPVITKLSPKYKAVASNATKWSSYLAYSSAATNGLYYTNAEAAIKKHGEANVTVWEPVKAPAVEEVAPENATEEEKAVVEDVIEEVTNNAAVKNNTVELPAEVVDFTIELAKVEVAEGTTPEAPETPVTVVTEISYTVTPSNAAGEKVSIPSEPITFRLPLPSNWASEKVKVIYNGTALDGDYTVMTDNGAKYVEVESQSFSTYTVQAIVPLFDGEGTEVSPYIIDSSDKLAALRNEVNGGEAYAGVFFKLTSDITLSGEWTAIGNGSRNGTGYTGNAFKGVFDGGNNTISGLTITSTTGAKAAIGLFGVVDGGTVKNLNLTDVNINVASSDLAGAAIGMMLNGATADAITVSGAVVGHDGVGGIVGRLIIDGTIANCTNNASVTSNYGGIGGIVGKAYYDNASNTSIFATIENCTNKGTITAPQYVGGIAGLARANVTNCVNEGEIVGGTNTGGIIGQLIAAGTVSGNENKVKISGTAQVGGIIGSYSQTTDYHYNNVTIANNINRGEIVATGDRAAILGCNNIDGFTAMTATGNQSFYYVEGLELFGNPEDMVIDATNKFILPTVAIVNGQEFSSFTEALEATKTMTGDVTVEIYDKVTFNQPLIGNYTSINFVGKDTDAEMYLDVQGYTTATGKKVSFTDLKLSKSEGGFIANAGFMNVAFGIYDVEEVTYTNCTFENGACASSGKVTFNGCTFKKSWDKYGLWAYGNVDVTVQGSTFADYRGIKMYAENGAAESVEKANLTVKNTNFSAVDNKPAIVLTYGESVVLEGNTYSSTGTFELDLDGKPNGVAVTSDVAPVCVNDNGACGVLVDGKIYTTVAQAAEVATETSTVTLLHSSNETVEFPMGTTIEKNGFTADNVTTVQPFADYVVLPQDITVNNYKALFGTNTVTDGTNYYATLQAAVEAVAGQANAVLYCKPGADVGSLQHAPVVSTLTIYGNGANVTGGDERDFDLGNTDPSAGKDITADMTLTVKHLNGCGAWGAKATSHTVNLVFENCANMGKVFISGTTGTLNITMNDCAFEGVIKEAVYSNADGAITLNNVAFSNLNKAINLNHKAAGTQTVTINGCSFTNCGADVAADQIPVRVLSSVDGGKTVLNVSNTTFTGTPANGADILLDYGVGVTEATVTNTAANVKPENKEGNADMVEVSAGTEYTYTNVLPVAKIGDVEYKTLAAAFEAVQNDETITLISDVELSEMVEFPAGKTATLDLNGMAITGVATSENSHIYALNNKGVLTIKDSKGNGSISARGIYNGYNGTNTDEAVAGAKLTIESGKFVSIDNGGATIYNCAELIINGGTIEGYKSSVINRAQGVATINGGTYVGGYDGGKSTSYLIHNTGGLLTINDAKVVSGFGAVSCNSGRTVINGGSFLPTGWEGYTSHVVYVGDASADVTINGGTFKMNYPAEKVPDSGEAVANYYKGKLSITGGTFYAHFDNVSPVQLSEGSEITGGTYLTHSGAASNHSYVKNFVKEGYELNADGTVAAKPVASINGTKYTSLAEAIAAVQDGETITLIDNVVLAERVTIPADKTLTIDLNGKSISMEESIIATAYAINNLGNLTITDGVGGGSINARGVYNGYGDGGANVATAKITVVNGTINAKGTNGGGAAIFNYGVADIQGGTFTSVASYAIALQTGSTMTIGENAIITGGINSWQSTLTITGGTISNDKSGKHVVYAGESAVTINGGTFHNNNSGNATIMASGSTAAVEITGGTFTLNIVDASSSYLIDATSSATYTISGGNFTGGIRAQGGTKYEIAGGTFTNEYGNYNVYEGGDINISGGTFTGSYAQKFATDNLAAGYELGANGAVGKASVAEVDGTKYASFADAIAAAQAGSEIKLLADATVEGTLALPAGIKLTSNGHTITGSIRMLGDLELNGPLTITGGLWVGKSGETLTATLSGDKLTASYFMFQRGTYTINADIDAVYGYLSYEGTFEVNSTIHTTGANGEVLYINGNVTLNDGAVLDSDNSVFVCNDNAELTLKSGSKVDSNVSITTSGAKLNIDATGMTAGASANITGTVTNSGNGTIAVVGNDKLEASIVNGKVVLAAKPVAKIGEQGYATLEAAFAAATEGQTITLLDDATPALTSQRAITKAAVIDLGGKTMTLKEDDLYFGTTTFKNGTIVVDPSVKPSTAVFWMFANQTLTFDNVKIVATGVTGTYLIGLEGENSDLNLLNGSEILVENTTALDLDIICVNGTNTCDIKVENSKVNVTNIDGRVFFRGNYTVKDSEVNLAGITKAGFRIEAGQTLSIEGTSVVNIEGEPRDGGIHMTDASANYTKAETATVNATVNEPKVAKIGETTYKTLQDAIDAVKEGETIILVDNVNVTTPAYGQNALNHARAINFTLDLNGKTLSANTGNSVFRFNIANSGATSNVTLTIKNGKIVAGSNTWCAVMASGISSDIKAIMNLEDLTIEASKAGDLAVKAWDNATINAKEVTVNTTKAAGGFYAVGGEIILDDCTVNQKGLHTAPYLSMAFAVSTNGKMTINSGTYSAEPTAAAEGDNQGSTHGSWVGGVMNSGGELIINGGTFSNGNFGDDALATAARGLIFADTNGKVTVNGGTFNALKSIFDFQNNLGGTSPVITVKGGNYSADPAVVTSYGSIVLEKGYYVVENNNVWTVERGLAGAGTEAEPYLINNVSDLKFFRDEVNKGVANKYNDPDVWVALGADIDLSGENWVGIGSATADHGFMGNFDGKNFKIKNLTITDPTLDSDGYAYAGLFGVTEGTDKDNQNTIKNLTIENVTISTTGDIVSAAIAYPYYTNVDNVKVCGDIKIQGGNYTAGVLAYTRRCVNASNLSIVGNDGSFVKGNQTVGGVISDIQMNGGLTAVYSNFSAEGITVTGEKSVGGIAGIIATQTLNGATVKNVTLNSSDARVGIVAGCLGGTSTISNVTYENVTGAATLIGASYDNAKAVAAKIGDTYYATLEAALAAQGNEVELLATYEVAAGETKTLDLKGKTVTMVYTAKATKNHTMINNSGNLTIESSVEGGKLSYTYAGEDLGVSYSTNTVTSNPGSVLTVKSGTIENLTYDKSVIAYAIDGLTNGGAGDVTVNIEGGVITSKRQAIRIFANSTTNTGALNISGGDITGRVIVQNASAKANKAALNITGGTFNANEYKSDVLYVGGSSSATIDINASVSGGTFNGEITETNVAGFITGGTYKTDVNQFCTLGYQAKANAEGLYAVEYTGEVAEFTIVDGQYTDFNIETPITVGTLTYKRNSLDVLKWNALYVPFDIPVSAFGDDYKVAYINDMHSSDANKNGIIDEDELTSLTMEGVYITNGTLRANHPYVIIPQNEEAKDLELVLNNVKVCTKDSITVDFSSAYIQYYVRGTYVKAGKAELNEGGDFFALNKGVWMKASETAKLGAFRIYFTMENKDGSPVVISDDAQIRVRIAGEEDQVTGIFTPYVENDVHFKKGIFDLMGRPVVTPEKGKIYIIDGKKRLY